MWIEIKRTASIFFTALLLLIPLATSAASRLDVQVTPKSAVLKKNIGLLSNANYGACD